VPHQNDTEVAENQHYGRKPEQHNLFDVHGAADHSGRYFLLMQVRK
jgi:alpha-beta hydrolase superfamily lysophospholipase